MRDSEAAAAIELAVKIGQLAGGVNVLVAEHD